MTSRGELCDSVDASAPTSYPPFTAIRNKAAKRMIAGEVGLQVPPNVHANPLAGEKYRQISGEASFARLIIHSCHHPRPRLGTTEQRGPPWWACRHRHQCQHSDEPEDPTPPPRVSRIT